MNRFSRLRGGALGVLVGTLLLLLAAGACAGGSQEDKDTVGLLNDPKVGLAHLNDELHTVREMATDPKIGFEHLNSELHTVKETLSELFGQMQLLEARAQQVEVAQTQASALQKRLDRGAAILEVLDTINNSFEETPPTVRDFLGVVDAIQDSGSDELKESWLKITDSVFASANPNLLKALSDGGSVFRASENLQAREKWMEFEAGMESGEGGATFWELRSSVREHRDPGLGEAFAQILEAAVKEGEPSDELSETFYGLVESSGNADVQQAVRETWGSQSQLYTQLHTKIQAIGDPSLDALYEAARKSRNEEGYESFWHGLLTELRESLG